MTIELTDHFCGGGGSTTGAIQVPGVKVRIAANHSQIALDVHNANHPDTEHANVDLHKENPRYFPKTDLYWASPECKKWSQANGSKLPAMEEGLFEDPLSDDAKTRSRLLMFDVLRYVEHHRYRLVFVENVVDIATQSKYRLAWDTWRRDLRNLGYKHTVVSLNSMHAQAFGMPAPQSRDRIYIAAWPDTETAPDFQRILRPSAHCPRCDQIVEARQAWKPNREVGRYRQAYLYVHGECGTYVEPGFLPALTAIDWSIPGQRIGDRLKPKTRLRVAAGIAKFWGPFHLEATGNQYDAADPKHPQFGDPNAYYRAWDPNDVLRTLHTGETKALAVPVEGRDGKQAQTVDSPMRTQTCRAETALVTPFVAELRGGGSDARSVNDPAATFCASGNHHALVTAYYGSSTDSRPVTHPLGTVTTVDRFALIHRMNSGGAEMTTAATDYLRTLTTAGHQALIQRADGNEGKRRVTAADLRAAEEMVPECLFRMFKPHEVAAGMAFPSTYDWQPDKTKKISDRELVKLAGNAVTPPSSRDVVGAGVESLS